MVVLSDIGKVEAYFVPFGDSTNLDVKEVHNLRRMYRRL
jgi:hypothetical protein